MTSGVPLPGRYLGALLLACLAWGAFRLHYPGVMNGVDVFHFKDAGCNLASGRGFVSASFVGSTSFDPLPWLSQGPVYPWLFGLHASLFGCTSAASAIFDLGISALLSVATLHLLTGWRAGGMNLLFLAAFLVFLPTGGYQWPQGRPDHLALLFVLLTWIAGAPAARGGGRHWLAFLLAGMALATSPYYGLVAAALAAFRLAWADGDTLRMPGWKSLLGCAAALVMPWVLTLICYAMVDPSAQGRMITHALSINAKRAHFLASLRGGFMSAGAVAALEPLRLLPALGLLLATRRALRPQRQGSQLMLLLAALIVATLIAFPAQGNYFSALGALAALLCVASLRETQGPRWPVGLSALLLLFLPLLPGVVMHVLNPVRMADSYAQESQRARERVARLQAAGLHGVVLVPPTHYFVYKPLLADIFNPGYLGPRHDPAAIIAALDCRAGGPVKDLLKPRPGWRLLDTPAGPAIRGGIPGLFRTSGEWDWGCAMWQRVDDKASWSPGRIRPRD